MAFLTKDDDNKSMLLVASAAVALVAVPLLLRSKKKKRPPLARSWSYTSEGMRVGVFPPPCKAPATIINAALYFDTCPSVEELAAQVITPLLKHDRFSLVPSDEGLREAKTPYQASDLVRTIEMEGDEDALHATIYEHLPDPLDQSEKPFWELLRIVNKKGGSVVVLRVHHCIGDGLSLVNVFDKVISAEDGKPAPQSKVTQALMNRRVQPPPLTSILSAIVHVLTLGASQFDDDIAVFNRDLTYSGNRKVLLFPNVSLDYIKQCKGHAPFPITINDILMGAISQAVHDYCVREKDDVLASKGDNLQCRALLPVSLPRAKDDQRPLQNRFVMVSSDLCVKYGNLVERLQAIHEATSALKKSPVAFVQLWMQNNVVSKLPQSLGRQTAHDIFSRHTLVLTNVPGPEQACWLAGQEVKGLQLFFPNVVPQVDLLTYAGTVYGNIIYDPANWKNGEVMATLYAEALVDMGKEFGVKDIPQDLQDVANKLE